MMKRILSILLAILMLSSCVVLAEEATDTASEVVTESAEAETTEKKGSGDPVIDKLMTGIVDMDRVYKYDYIEVKKEETTVEVLKQKNAIEAVVALGLMDYLQDGTFGENQGVKFKDFANIVLKLNSIVDAELEEEYNRYSDTLFTTQRDAVYYLVAAAGYDVFDGKYKGDYPREETARREDFLDGISFVPEKNITRGELARLIFNVLQAEMVEQTAYGDVAQYEKIKGKTLIKELFDAEIVYGTVTGQNGINLYNDGVIETGEIAIDRVLYRLNDLAVDDILGYRVMAIASFDDNIRTLLCLTIDEKDKTLNVKLGESTSIGDGKFVYSEDGKEKKVALSNLKRIVINDTQVSLSELTNRIEDLEGEARFIQTERTGDYSLLFVKNPSSYVVNRISLRDNRIHLDYGATHNELSYIEIGGKKLVTVIKNGKTATINDILPGSVIDVIENEAKTAALIYVSDAAIDGKVEAVDGDIITIDDENYTVSSSYIKAQETDTNLPDITLNLEGSFKINTLGAIVGFVDTVGQYKIGVLGPFGKVGESRINKAYAARILVNGNQWENLNFAEKVTVDGVEKKTPEQVIDILEESKNNIQYKPIRYGLNNKDEIEFLDTILSNVEENGDADAMKLAGAKEAMVVNWTCSAGKAGTLSETDFIIAPNYHYIEIPEDKSVESDFFIGTRHSFVVNDEIDLTFYNADDLNRIRILVKESSGAPSIGDQNQAAIVFYMGKIFARDDDGEEVMMVKVLAAKGQVRKLKVTNKSIKNFIDTLTPGDIFMAIIDVDEIAAIKNEVFVQGEDLLTTIYEGPEEGAQRGLGVVEGIDAKNQTLKVRMNDTVQAWIKMNVGDSIGLYNVADNTGEVIDFGDISVGDKIWGNGLYNAMHMTIIR